MMLTCGPSNTHLREHELEQHVQPRVPLDHLLELLQHRVQLFGVRVDMLNGVVEEFVVVSLVLRQPVARLAVSAAILARSVYLTRWTWCSSGTDVSFGSGMMGV